MTVWHHRQHRFVTIHAKGVSIGSKARALRLPLDPIFKIEPQHPKGGAYSLRTFSRVRRFSRRVTTSKRKP